MHKISTDLLFITFNDLDFVVH